MLLLAALGCSSSAEPSEKRSPGAQAGSTKGCGPPAFEELRGRAPSYVPRRLDRFPNDHAMCAGQWVLADRSFVPQSLAVGRRTAWVSGYDGGGPRGTRLCRVVRVDLRSGRVLEQAAPISGSVGARPEVNCRHGGGLARTTEGLWLAEGQRLWLLDPGSLDVLRVWSLADPLRGSFAVADRQGRIGLGEFKFERVGRLDWFDTAALLTGTTVDLTSADAVDRQRVPPMAQGAVVADLGAGPAAVWFVTSNTRCGVLVGPRGQRLGYLPGAEGTVLRRGELWTVSESTSRPYYEKGDRPVVPMLARFDLSAAHRWARAGCTP
ncbi:MAG TPA: hypothetical protein VFO49_10895 [Nocardioides sp.]|nr:hypothetical protein [Nocardioides sp.]